MTGRSRVTRLPPPIPPPPELLQETFYGANYAQLSHAAQLKQSLMMSPDVSQNSAQMHRMQSEQHVRSLMNVYQKCNPKKGETSVPFDRENDERCKVVCRGEDREERTKERSPASDGQMAQMNLFHRQIDEKVQNEHEKDRFDPEGQVDWATPNTIGGIFTSKK